MQLGLAGFPDFTFNFTLKDHAPKGQANATYGRLIVVHRWRTMTVEKVIPKLALLARLLRIVYRSTIDAQSFVRRAWREDVLGGHACRCKERWS
jgi:hypothetical protein